MEINKFLQEYFTQEMLPPLDRHLAGFYKKRSQWGKRDRAVFTQNVFDSVRYFSSIVLFEYAFARSEGPEQLFAEFDSREKMINAFLGIRGDVWGEWLKIFQGTKVKKSKRFEYYDFYFAFETIERHLLRAGVPPFYFASLQKRAAQSAWEESEFISFVQNLQKKSPLWIRCNKDEERVLSELQAKDYEYEQGPIAHSWCLKSGPSLKHLACFQDGCLEAQDLGSQRIGLNLDVAAGDRVWDVCAGAGGKTLQLASLAQGQAQIYATDIRDFILKKQLIPRMQRAGFDNFQIAVWDGKSLDQLEKGKRFDKILVDAPCSSSGTWRSAPDQRFRFLQEELPKIKEIQLGLLNLVKTCLDDKGILEYATCSFLVEENEEIVAEFLQMNPDFVLLEMKLEGSPKEDADTLFWAKFKKKN